MISYKKLIVGNLYKSTTDFVVYHEDDDDLKPVPLSDSWDIRLPTTVAFKENSIFMFVESYDAVAWKDGDKDIIRTRYVFLTYKGTVAWNDDGHYPTWLDIA